MKQIYLSYPDVKSNSVGVEIHNQLDFNNFEKECLKRADLFYKNATVESWTALGSNIQINYATHGLFRYFGKFPSTIAAQMINEYSNKNDIVLDPMCGSGTTCVESLLLNRKCIGLDINPLSVLLSKVKITKLDRSVLEKELEKITKNYKPLTAKEYPLEICGLKDPDHWFLKETQNSLRGLFKCINEINNKDRKDFFTICLLACIRTVSRATSQQGRLFLDVTTAQPDCLNAFVRKTKKNIEALSKLPNNNCEITIKNHNASKPISLDKKVDLIIIHPPYFNSYKYSSINSLELAWMKKDHAEVRKEEVREFFKIGNPDNLDKYVEDMNNVLLNVSKVLKKGGAMCLMIGDTIMRNQYVKVTKALIDKFINTNKNIKVEKVIIRVPKFTEASWAASQRRHTNSVGINICDFIIVFRG